MFYRSLPKEGTRYYDITASCEGNEAFTYTVKDNPDLSDFLDINCIGNAQKGKVWTYEISYTMISGEDFGDGIIVDVIGFGWPVALHYVTAKVSFPDVPSETPNIYVGAYGRKTSETHVNVTYSQDKKDIYMYAECLPLAYNNIYNETMAEGITLECAFAEGVFESYTHGRIYTKAMPWILLGGAICIGISVFGVHLFRKKREIISVVSVRAPKGMDPLKMGVLLDGTADSEDITSMIYYFADKGYLQIDFTDEDDPLLIKKQDVPQDTPIYAKTLFNGLFKRGDAVRISDLTERYYTSVQKAQMQVPKPKMYEGRSVVGFLLGGAAATLYMLCTLFFMGRRIGGGYTYLWGVSFGIPVVAIWLVAILRENYRYKWKKSARSGSFLLMLAVAACAVLVFAFGTAKHIATEWEKLVVCVCGFTATILSTRSISRKEKYVRDLGEILGFKEFIRYAEKERLEALLNDEPQLFYSVLPYAQVLGVSDVWEEKFRGLTIEPPAWCVGYQMSVFDYMLLNRCMRRSMAVAMRPPQQSNGSHVGHSGGGGHFGGFGGGGFGGGGGGAR